MNRPDIDYLVLREAQRTVCLQTRHVTLGLFFIISVALFSLKDSVPAAYTLTWVIPLLGAMAARALLARRLLRELDLGFMPPARLTAWSNRLRMSCIVNQAFAGSTVWLTHAGGGDDQAALFVTLLSALFAVGAINNLAADFRSVAVSIPLLMGQLMLYWAGEGARGLTLMLTLLLVTVLMIRFARNHSRIFRESVAMRAEQDALLAEQKVLTTNQANMLSQVRAALDEAEAANRGKAQFLAAASHDLRQPLHALQLLADTLAIQPLPADARLMVDQQRQAIAALSEMFTNLLDLSRFESGDVQPRWVDLPVAQLYARLDAEFAPQCAERGLEWRVRSVEGAITTDQVHLARLLRNLLSNAVRYTEKGYIELGAAFDGQRVRLWVNDSGPGIPADKQEEIFKPFVQLGNKARNRDRGFGLGLSIARHLANVLGSALFLRSAPGEGSRFTVFARAAQTTQPSTQLAAAEATRSPSLVSGLSVWLVEDDEFVRTAFGHQFQALGLEHRLAASPTEFHDMLARESAPDAVIFDDMLGDEETGLDLAIELSSVEPDTRILIATANSRQDRLQVIEDSGFSWMQKPLTTQQILAWLTAGQKQTAEVPQVARLL